MINGHFTAICESDKHTLQYGTLSTPPTVCILTADWMELTNDVAFAAFTAGTSTPVLLYASWGDLLLEDSVLLSVSRRQCD